MRLIFTFTIVLAYVIFGSSTVNANDSTDYFPPPESRAVGESWTTRRTSAVSAAWTRPNWPNSKSGC